MNSTNDMIEDQIIPPGGHWARVVKRNQILRIVDLEGQQAVDFLCYNAAQPEERYNAADTIKIAGNIFITNGTKLYSGLGTPLFTIIEDTCGRHDTIAGCCSAESNMVRYGKQGTPNCRDNFLAALAPFGLGRRDIVANVNFFMSVPVNADGSMAIAEGRSKPGDYVDLRAEMDALVVLSNCPQIYNPASGGNPTPIRVVILNPGDVAAGEKQR
jgi:urea carboxylase-associated protein 1